MFTGIIEEQGTIQDIKNTSASTITLTIGAKEIMSDMKRGDSIAINGICLTVTSFTTEIFMVDVMPETMRSTSLYMLEKGSKVNLERAMAANSRFGGHLVSGHIDGTGKVVHKRLQENAILFDIEIKEEDRKWIILKGSIAVDGISLTIFQVGKNTFSMSIIPHTAEMTTLGEKAVGDIVNIEYDMLGKYVHQMLELKNL